MGRSKYYLESIPTLLGNIENWWALFFLPLARQPVILKLRNGLSFKVRSAMDAWIVKETCIDRSYETHGATIEDGWTVIDIGAGIGDFAVQIAHKCPGSRVYAFEPFPESYALLQENAALNAVRNIESFPLAIGATTGRMVLLTTGEAVQHTTTADAANRASPTGLEVSTISLDDLLKIHNIEHCDFLKMDCEGGEYDILFNAPRDTLDRIRRICLEYHDGFTRYSHQDLEAHLQSSGYMTRTSRNPVHSVLGLLYAWRV